MSSKEFTTLHGAIASKYYSNHLVGHQFYLSISPASPGSPPPGVARDPAGEPTWLLCAQRHIFGFGQSRLLLNHFYFIGLLTVLGIWFHELRWRGDNAFNYFERRLE
jgi:hypothetical protein